MVKVNELFTARHQWETIREEEANSRTAPWKTILLNETGLFALGTIVTRIAIFDSFRDAALASAQFFSSECLNIALIKSDFLGSLDRRVSLVFTWVQSLLCTSVVSLALSYTRYSLPIPTFFWIMQAQSILSRAYFEYPDSEMPPKVQALTGSIKQSFNALDRRIQIAAEVLWKPLFVGCVSLGRTLLGMSPLSNSIWKITALQSCLGLLVRALPSNMILESGAV